MRTTRLPWALALALVLAGCTTQVPLSELPFPCDGGADQCPGGWHCGIAGKCHAPEPGAYACNTNDDCEGWHCGTNSVCHPLVPAAYGCTSDTDCEGWRCSRVDHICHALDAGAYACLDDTDCQEGWRCGLTGTCLDASGDRLDDTAGGTGTDTGTKVNPLRSGFSSAFAGSQGRYTLENSNQPMQMLTLVVDGGIRVLQRFADRVRVNNQDAYAQVIDIPTPGPVTSVSAFEGLSFWVTGSSTWGVQLAGDAGTVPVGSPQLLSTLPAARLRVQPRARELTVFNQDAYSLFNLDVGPPVPLGIAPDGGGPVDALVSGGSQQLLLDMVITNQDAIAATQNGLFVAERFPVDAGLYAFRDRTSQPTQIPDWRPIQTDGLPNTLCAPIPLTAGPFRVSRFISSRDFDDVGAELAPLDGGSVLYLGVLGPNGSPGASHCGSYGGVELRSLCTACPMDAGSVSLVATAMASKVDTAQGSYHYSFDTRCRFTLADGGQVDLSFEVDQDGPDCRHRNPHEDGQSNVERDLAVASQEFTGVPALLGAHGQVWFGVDGGFEALDSWMLDAPPEALADLPVNGGSLQLTALTAGWVLSTQPGMGLIRTTNLGAAGFTPMTVVEGKPSWLVLQNGQVLDAEQGGNGLPPPVAKAIPSAVPLQFPSHSVLAPIHGGGTELLLTSNDSILAADITASLATPGTPPVDLILRLAPLPRVQILSIVAVPPADAATGQVQNLLEGYALTSNALFHFTAQSQQRWQAETVNAPDGEWLEVWADGARGRLGYSDGTVYSLPNRVKISDPVPGDTVQDYQQACGTMYALGRRGLYRLVGSTTSPLGQWQPVTLGPGVSGFFDGELPGGRLYPSTGSLFAFSPLGIGVKLVCQ